MSLTKSCLVGAVALIAVAFSQATDAAPVSWTVDSTQSWVRLSIPDQSLSIDGTTVTARIRNQDSTSTWTDAGGRLAAVGGSISTDYVDGSSISFLSGGHNLAALEAGSFRPNPAAFNPGATNGDNPDGSYTNTSGAAAAFAGRVRASALGGLINTDLAFIAFRNVSLDINSGVLAIGGGGAFAGANDFGIASAFLDVDGVNATLVGQVVPDMLNESLDGLLGANSSGGTVTSLGGAVRQLVYNINVPIQIDLDGTLLNANVAGTIVATAIIPEPASIGLAVMGALALAGCVIRRRRA